MYAPTRVSSILGVSVLCGALLGTVVAQAQDPWADQVVSYDLGTGGEAVYSDPLVTLGEPERYTGEGVWPAPVTPFNGAWGSDEVVSLGEGGYLTVRFDEPITNDPTHLYGVDFMIFGNGFFGDDDYPNGQVAGLFEEGPFAVSISADGTDFTPLAGTLFDAMFPTLGYLDLDGPYDPNPGSVLSDFTKPVDPSLTYDDFHGRTFAEIVTMYDGSGGGIPLDIGPTGLDEVYYVRIDVLAGASSPEFDAFAVVPEPATAVLLGTFVFVTALRRGR